MADNNPSNFVSWGQQMGLTGDLERTLYERALKAAQDEQGAASSSLESAYGQARDANRQEVANTGTATTTLQQTGSYNDYLRHQAQAQAKATAALQGGNSVSTLMRQQLAPRAWGSTANFDQGTQALLQRQAQLEQSRAVSAGGDERMFAARQKYVADQEAAKTAAQRALAAKNAEEIARLTSGANTTNKGVYGDQRYQQGMDVLRDYRTGWDIERLRYGQQLILDAAVAAAKRVMQLGGSREQAKKAYDNVIGRTEGIRGAHRSEVDDLGDSDVLFTDYMKG